MYYCGLKSVGINKNIKLFRPFFAMKFIFEKPFNVEILRSTEASIFFFVIAYWNIRVLFSRMYKLWILILSITGVWHIATLSNLLPNNR